MIRRFQMNVPRLNLLLALLLGALTLGAMPSPVATAAAAAAPCEIYQGPEIELQPGDSGPSVQYVQCLLVNNWDYDLVVDGEFGPQTEAAVREIQQIQFGEDDGIIGPCTWAILHDPELLPDC